MAAREVDGFEIWAEANQMGDEPAVAFVLTKDSKGKVATMRHTVITMRVFTTLEDAQAAARQVVMRVASVSENGVPSPLVL